MLKYDISYPDTFRSHIDNTIFTIVKNDKNKYVVYVRTRIGDEFFDKHNHTEFSTLHEASKECEMTYERMTRK